MAEFVENVVDCVRNNGFVPASQQELFLPCELCLLDLVRKPHEPLRVGLRVIINWRRRQRRLPETSVRRGSAPWISVQARERRFPRCLESAVLVSRQRGGDAKYRLLCEPQPLKSREVLAFDCWRERIEIFFQGWRHSVKGGRPFWP